MMAFSPAETAAWQEVLGRRKRWTRADLPRLCDAGLLDADGRYELLQGGDCANYGAGAAAYFGGLAVVSSAGGAVWL